MRFTVTLLMLCTVASSARSQTLTQASPDVIAAGSGDVVVTLRSSWRRWEAPSCSWCWRTCSGRCFT